MATATTFWRAINYAPHEKQLEFHASDARFKVASCGRRFGKSRMAAAECEPFLFSSEVTRGWIVGPEYKTGEKEFRYMWQDLIQTMHLHKTGLVKRKAYNVRTGEMYIEMENGSRVDVMSADHPDGLVGEGLDWVIVSEAAKQNLQVWEKYLRPALADKHGIAIFPSTPEGFNWFYDVYQIGQNRKKNPDWESWRYPSWMNPYVYPGGFEDPEVQDQLRTPDDPWFWQEIGADFRSVVGLIYGEFDENVHVQPMRFHPEWDNYLAMDFGFTNPFACYDVQVDPSDNVYIWREHYVRQKSIWEHCEAMKARTQPAGYHINCGYGDSADAKAVYEMNQFMCPTLASDEAKDIWQGIRKVKEFLAPDARLFIDPSCVNLIQEFNLYKTAKGVAGRDPRDLPEKANDHGLDAIRYFIMHRFVLGADAHLEKFMVNNEDISSMIEEEVSIGRGIFTMGEGERVTL